VMGYVFRFFLPDVNLGPCTVIFSVTDHFLSPSLDRFTCSRLPSLDVRMSSRSRWVFPSVPWYRLPLWWKRRANWSRSMPVTPYFGLLTSSMATSPYLGLLAAVSTLDGRLLPHVDVALVTKIRTPGVLQDPALPLVVVAHDEEAVSAAVL
jgi:hypothetical protein